MSINGFIEYKRREFCNDVKCKVQMVMNDQEDGSERYENLRSICKTNCIHSTYAFHHWLIEKGYLLLRKGEDNELGNEESNVEDTESEDR